jgi:hypothetical protein
MVEQAVLAGIRREVDHPNLLARSLAAAAQVFGDLVGEANLPGGQK